MSSIKPLGNGKYKLYIELGYDQRGKRKRRTKVIEASGPRAAEKKLRAFEIEVMNEKEVDLKNPPFENIAERWMKNYASQRYAGKTLDNYQYVLKPILEFFTGIKIKNISFILLEDFFIHEKEAGRGSLVKKYDVLKSVFQKAVDWKVIAENPIEGLEKPKNPNKEMSYYKPSELTDLMNAIQDLSERHQLMVLISLIGALRRGEVLGIALDDAVDFDNNQIHVFRSLSYSKAKGLELKRTKSEDQRVVTLPHWLMKRLHAYYIKKLNLKMEMRNLWKGFKDYNGKDVILFVSDEHGYPFQPNAYTRFWGRFMERTDIKKIRLHDLRHSSASTMLSEGVNMKVIQKRLGHKNIKTTLNTYSHVSTEDDEKAANVFEKYGEK